MAPPHSNEDRARRRKSLMIQKSLQKESENRSFDDDMSDNDVGDIDFSKEIHPIKYYIDDREKMIEHMFFVLKGEKLQRIIPAILKDQTIEELKADCLVHLLGMSKKRILAILEGEYDDIEAKMNLSGRDLNSSSDSETEDERTVDNRSRSSSNSSSPDVRTTKTDGKITIDEESRHRPKNRKSSTKDENKSHDLKLPCIVISDDETVDVKPLGEEQRMISKLRKERRVLKAKIDKRIKKAEKRRIKTLSQVIEVIEDSNDEQKDTKSDSNDDDKGKSLLEILELEMRARAIRALLKNTPNAEEPVPVSILDIKPEPSNVEPKINKTIAEVINEESAPSVEERDLSNLTDDIEMSEVCDVLTLTIDDDDDDDDVEIEPLSTSKSISTSNSNNDNQQNTQSKSHSTEAIAENISKSSEKSDDVENKGDDATWSERWIESKGVKDVMKNNKLCANIRKRMRFAKMLKEKQSQKQEKEKNDPQTEILSNLNTVEESSVAQYELIKSLDKFKANDVHSSDKESQSTENKSENGSAESVPEEAKSCTVKLTEVARDESVCRKEEPTTIIDDEQRENELSNDVSIVENSHDCFEFLSD